MSNIHFDGGPAFPHEDSGSPAMRPGMSLRDYFIAHAPAEPQQWFRPVMPHPCPEAPAQITDMTPEEREDKSAYMEDMINVGDVRSNRLAAYYREYESWRHWCRAWNSDAEKQRWVRWPAAWADEMLKARTA